MAEEYEKIIRLVKDRPFLYDASHAQYKDNDRKRDAWREIALEIGLDRGEVAKYRWRNLRDTYVKYLRTQSNTTSLRKRIRKKWMWANEMHFLLPHLVKYSNLSLFNHSDSIDWLYDPQIEIKEESIDMIVEQQWEEDKTSMASQIPADDNSSPLMEDKTQDFANCVSQCSSGAGANEDIRQPTMKNTTANQNRKNTNGRHQIATNEAVSRDNISLNAGEKPSSKTNNRNKRNSTATALDSIWCRQPDAIDLLFLSYAQTLKAFSPRLQIDTKMQIAHVMNRAELRAIGVKEGRTKHDEQHHRITVDNDDNEVEDIADDDDDNDDVVDDNDNDDDDDDDDDVNANVRAKVCASVVSTSSNSHEN